MLLCPWESPGKNTGVGGQARLQGIFRTQGLKSGLLHCRRLLYRLSHCGSPHRRRVKSQCPRSDVRRGEAGAQQEGNRGSSPASWKTPASQTAGAGPVCNLDLLGCAPLAGRSVLGRGAPWRGWLPGTQRASSGSDRLSHPLPLPRHPFPSGSKGTLSHVLRLA